MKKTATLSLALIFCFASSGYAKAGYPGDAHVFILALLFVLIAIVALMYAGEYIQKNGKRLMLAATSWLKKKAAMLIRKIHGPGHDALLYGKV